MPLYLTIVKTTTKFLWQLLFKLIIGIGIVKRGDLLQHQVYAVVMGWVLGIKSWFSWIGIGWGDFPGI